MAEYRAQEFARPDALFSDPLAARLSGERGRIIAAEAKRSFGNGWFFIARTKLIDDLIATSLAEGCDRVIDLAAGLDTRPYRLDLPPDLKWIEMDLPDLTAQKSHELAGETPRCRLSRVAVDLTDAGARSACLAQATAGAANALVITEGLLLYLDEPDVRALAGELRSPQIKWWIADIIGPLVVALSSRAALRGKLNNAPVVFGPDNGIAYFEQAGWRVESVRSQLEAAAEWRRLSLVMRLLARLPKADPRSPGRSLWSAVMRLSQAEPSTPQAGTGAGRDTTPVSF